jgi:hypothetical protein
MEECLYQPLHQWPCPGEIPSDPHLIKLYFLIDLGELDQISHLLALLSVKEL